MARLVVLLLFAFTSSLFAQGSLEPGTPPGPVMKSLDQVEPRIPVSAPGSISSPGSYYLTQNLSGSIIIAADNVSLDLSGYTISGGEPYLINVLINRTNVAIFNGTLDGNGAGITGIRATSTPGSVFISDLKILDIYICTEIIGATGLVELDRVVCDTTAREGFRIIGINATDYSVRVTNCTVTNANTDEAAARAAISIGHGGDGSGDVYAVVTGNHVFGNRTEGIRLTSDDGTTKGVVSNNQVFGNGGAGFNINGDISVVRNIAQGNGTNYDMGTATNTAPVNSVLSTPGPWDNLTDPVL